MWSRNLAMWFGVWVRLIVDASRSLARTRNSDPEGRLSVDALPNPLLFSILLLGQCASYVDSVSSRDFAAIPLVRCSQEGTYVFELLHRARIERS
eukprot:5551736-Pleurochrysis_carterae.AAC.1